MRSPRIVLAILGIVVASCLGLLGLRAARSGLTWQEMDRDHDGSTTIGEVLNAGDVGKRTVDRFGRTCVETFWLKDGLPVKVVCPAG